jgi:hypothetical protein
MFFKLKFTRKNVETKFHHLYLFTKKLSLHKTFEFQIMHYFDSWFNIEINIQFSGSDHAGPSFEISFFGYILNLHIYDNRHWNQEKNTWI